jgi:hypothetical protein
VRVDASVHVERAGVAALAKAAHERLGWLCREQPVNDFGVDAILEHVENGHTAGRLLGAQIKSGTSWFHEPTRDGWTFRFNDEHARYWFDYDIPVVIVLHDPVSGTLYWHSLSHGTAESTGKDWKVTVPAEQQIDETSVAALTRLARPAREGGDPAEQRFARWLDRLPGEARDRLERTRRRALQDGDTAAARAVERLADLLQAGSPAETVSTLFGENPRMVAGQRMGVAAVGVGGRLRERAPAGASGGGMLHPCRGRRRHPGPAVASLRRTVFDPPRPSTGDGHLDRGGRVAGRPGRRWWPRRRLLARRRGC